MSELEIIFKKYFIIISHSHLFHEILSFFFRPQNRNESESFAAKTSHFGLTYSGLTSRISPTTLASINNGKETLDKRIRKYKKSVDLNRPTYAVTATATLSGRYPRRSYCKY